MEKKVGIFTATFFENYKTIIFLWFGKCLDNWP